LYGYSVFIQGNQTGPPLPDQKGSYYITGTVCQKDTFYFYLESFQISTLNPGEDVLFTPQSTDYQNYKLQCAYPEGEIHIGETILIRGSLSSFSHATNPGQFDAANYYYSRKILGKVKATVLLYGDGKQCFLRETIWQCRTFLDRQIQSVFGEEAGVLEAILLGEKSHLEEEQKSLYKRSGLLHIFSISGLHISFLGLGLCKLLQRIHCSKRQAYGIALLVLLVYGMMTGGSISAIRAIGMFALSTMAVFVGRTPDTLTSLGLLAVLVALTQPGRFESSGFYFSFGSVLGICVFLPLLQRKVEERWKEKKLLRKVLLAALPSCSVMLVTLPLQAWFLYEIPVWSVVLNMIIVPAMSLLFGTALLGLLPGMIPARWIVRGIVTAIDGLCRGVEQIPGHIWHVGKPASLQMIAYYMLLLGVLYLWSRKRSGKKWLTEIVKEVMPIGLLLLCLAFPRKAQAQVVFLDVGQGQCSLVHTKEGNTYLFDCGSTTNNQPGQRILLPYLKYCGINTLEKVFVSHIDTDHISGIVELFQQAQGEGLCIKEVVLPVRAEENEEIMDAILQYQKTYPIRVVRAYAGDCMTEEDIQITVWNPPQAVCRGEEIDWEDNELSQVLYLTLPTEGGEQRSILLLGDVEKRGEEYLISKLKQEGIERIDVLQVAHHGSGGATTQALLDCFQGRVATISCAMKNTYGHPNARLVLRLEQAGYHILETRKTGAIILRLSD